MTEDYLIRLYYLAIYLDVFWLRLSKIQVWQAEAAGVFAWTQVYCEFIYYYHTIIDDIFSERPVSNTKF